MKSEFPYLHHIRERWSASQTVFVWAERPS